MMGILEIIDKDFVEVRKFRRQEVREYDHRDNNLVNLIEGSEWSCSWEDGDAPL